MTRRIDPLLHKPVRLERAQLVVSMHCVTLEAGVDLTEAQPPAHEMPLDHAFHLPSMSRSAAPTVQLDEQSRRS